MQSFFWHVLTAPRVYAKLLLEIDVAVRSGAIPSSGNIEWSQAQELTYFQACLKEAMRMRPAVGLNITRYVPPEGAEIEGEHFPAGTRVAVNGWVIHRHKATFGEDADFYRPERWTEDEENAKVMERYMVQVCTRHNRLRNEALSPLYCRLLTSVYSSAEALTSASAGTWRCWRSTRSCPACCETSASSSWTPTASSRPNPRSSSSRKG